jgi:hypothetical protein
LDQNCGVRLNLADNSSKTPKVPGRLPPSLHCLALQLHFPFEMGLSRFCLMGSSPERPCDDMGGLNLSLGQPDGNAADFLH